MAMKTIYDIVPRLLREAQDRLWEAEKAHEQTVKDCCPKGAKVWWIPRHGADEQFGEIVGYGGRGRVRVRNAHTNKTYFTDALNITRVSQ